LVLPWKSSQCAIFNTKHFTVWYHIKPYSLQSMPITFRNYVPSSNKKLWILYQDSQA
jgi:hypothetical protein